jgi:hypothetical protein
MTLIVLINAFIRVILLDEILLIVGSILCVCITSLSMLKCKFGVSTFQA